MAKKAKPKAPGKKPKKKGGRPTDYKPEFAEQAYRLCLLGATDEELATFFGKNVDTIYEWKNRHKLFSDSIKRGKQVADSKVAASLYERACGYSHPDVDLRVINNKLVKTPLVKHYPPDTLAALSWLNNRQPDKWKQRPGESDKLKGAKIKIKITKKSKPNADDAKGD